MSREPPRSIEEAAQALLAELEPDQRDQLRAVPRDDLIMTHFSLGMFVRNTFELWREDAPLTRPGPRDFLRRDPDRVSARIIERAWEVAPGRGGLIKPPRGCPSRYDAPAFGISDFARA